MSSPLVRPAIRSLQAYQPGEQPLGAGVIKLNTNENPYPPSPRVLEAIRAAAGADLRLYPDPMANALRERAARIYGLEREQILAGNGSDELLSMIVRACVGPGERVVYAYPTYSLYDTLVAIQEGQAVHVPYPRDFALPAAIAEGGDRRVTFICHPNSPSGTAVPLARLREVAARVSGLLVIDEAYVDFAEESALELVRERRNVVVLRTFSKSFSLAGLRIGLMFGAAELIEHVSKVKDSYNLNRLSMVAAVAALDDYEWMRGNVARVCATRERLSAELRRRGFEVLPSQANFVLARRDGQELAPLYEALRERRVLVRYFALPELRDAVRISVGTEEETDALLHALDAVV